MARKRSRARSRAKTPAKTPVKTPVLAALLEPHLDALSEAAAAREAAQREAAQRAAAQAARAARRRLDEAELMALIFEKLDPDNPRVCEGIEFERLIILTEPEPGPGEPEPEPPEAELEQPTDEPEPPASDEFLTPPDARVWIGRGWVDDIRPIPAAVLDRPELDEQQRALLVRAARRSLTTCNLRHLGRAEALAHLELFVKLCRTRRLRFCRVIPGKGIDSRSDPVLKRALIEWCQAGAAVLGWAPELDRHGEWGAAILELRARDR